MIFILRLPVLCRDSDAEQGIAAARTKILAVDAVGGTCGGFGGEGHGGDFERHRQAVLINVRVKGRGEGTAGGRQREQGSVSAEFRLFLLLFLLAVDGDLVLVFGFAVLCRDGDAEQGVAAASAQVLPIDAVGGSLGCFGGEGHGGNFKGHGQIVLVNLRVKGRGEGASGGGQGEKESVAVEFRLFFLLFLTAVYRDGIHLARLAVLRCDGDAEQSVTATRA